MAAADAPRDDAGRFQSPPMGAGTTIAPTPDDGALSPEEREGLTDQLRAVAAPVASVATVGTFVAAGQIASHFIPVPWIRIGVQVGTLVFGAVAAHYTGRITRGVPLKKKREIENAA